MPAFSVASSDVASSSPVSSISWSHTALEPNEFLLIGLYVGTSNVTPVVAVNGSAATQNIHYNTGPMFDMWSFQLTSSGAATITCSGWLSTNVTAQAMSFTGTTGIVSTAATSGTASGAWQLGLAAGGSSRIIAGFLRYAGGDPITSGTNVTRPSTTLLGNPLSIAWAGIYSSGGSSLAVSGGTDPVAWNMIGVSLSTMAAVVVPSGGVSWWY